MKKILFLLFVNMLLITGCVSDTSGLKPFDKELELKEQMKELTFQPKLPTKIPFKVTGTDLRHPPSTKDIMVIDFISSDEKKNQLSLLIANEKKAKVRM